MGSAAGVNVDSSLRCGVVFSFFPISHSQVHRRPKQLEVESGKGDFVSTKKYLTLPESCCSQSPEWEERKKSRAKRGSPCTRRGSRKTVTCAWSSRGGTRVPSGLIARQMEEPEEERKKSRAGDRLALKSRKTVTLILFYLLFFFLINKSFVNRQSLRKPVDGCGSVGSRTLRVRMHCPISSLVRHVSRKVFSFACT